jgi:hypothetical protein
MTTIALEDFIKTITPDGIQLSIDGKPVATLASYILQVPTPAPVAPAPMPVPGQPILMGCTVSDVQLPSAVKIVCTATAVDQDYDNVLLDIEVLQNGVRVGQSFQENMNLKKGQSASYEYEFQPASAAGFTVSTGIFDSPTSGYAWGTKRAFTDNIATFKVSPAVTYLSTAVNASGLFRSAEQVDSYVSTYPELKVLADQPTADWLGDWSGDVQKAVSSLMTQAKGQIVQLVIYNIPGRDNGNFSAGGESNAAAYKTWISQIVAGISNQNAIVVLEPDALGLLSALPQQAQTDRIAMLKDAISQLKTNTDTKVYMDASMWVSPIDMAKLIEQVNPGNLDGFSLNVSGYGAMSDIVQYGRTLSTATSGLHYVIDTSRNGNGGTNNGQWCNPPGQKIGQLPQLNPDGSNQHLDAYLWIKAPGESDGTCNGGPSAGTFWVAGAQQLVK